MKREANSHCEENQGERSLNFTMKVVIGLVREENLEISP